MTNEDKAELRNCVRELYSSRDKHIAASIGCSLSTVRKYRKAITGAKP